MGHTPFGYRIENGIAVIEAAEAEKIHKLYEIYLSGLSLANAAKEAGVAMYHCTVRHVLSNKHYLGDAFYPALIDQETFDKVAEELKQRAERLGRTNLKKRAVIPSPLMQFTVRRAERHFEDPVLQAEYLYGLIEGDVKR